MEKLDESGNLKSDVKKIEKLVTDKMSLKRDLKVLRLKLEAEIEAKEILQKKFESFRPSWSEWSSCSKTCPGVKTRMDKCSFNNKETDACDENCSKSGKFVDSLFSDLYFIFSIGYA